MMGHRDKLIDGLEVDAILARGIYCYLKNNSKLKSYAKNKINRRDRRQNKNELSILIGLSYLDLSIENILE